MAILGRFVLGISLGCGLAIAAQASADTKPRVRAITGFVRIEPARYVEQIDAALIVLRAAKAEFAHQGYEVETLRIVTQPLGELVAGLSEDAALKLLQDFDDLSVEEEFVPSVGPAMLGDDDDPRTMQLLAKALAVLPNLHGNAVIAGADGIHWKVIHETAALVRYVTDHSAGAESHGNLDFTATAMLKPYAPFFPGAYHLGPGKTFSIGARSGERGTAGFCASSRRFRRLGRGTDAPAHDSRQGRGNYRTTDRTKKRLGFRGG